MSYNSCHNDLMYPSICLKNLNLYLILCLILVCTCYTNLHLSPGPCHNNPNLSPKPYQNILNLSLITCHDNIELVNT